jgi:hypothetical protein
MKTCLAAILAGCLVLSAGTGAAVACQGSTTLFEDDFSFADPAWGGYAGTVIEGGSLTINIDPDSWYALENQAGFYNDFDLCHDLVQRNNDPTQAFGSILFWGIDYDNFYSFDVATNGFIRVSRLQNGRWLTPVAWTETTGLVHPGILTNQQRVVVQGNVATAFVNGTQVAKFRGQPPDGGGLIGVFGWSPPGSPASYEFSKFVVTSADGGTGTTEAPPELPAEEPVEEPMEEPPPVPPAASPNTPAASPNQRG